MVERGPVTALAGVQFSLSPPNNEKFFEFLTDRLVAVCSGNWHVHRILNMVDLVNIQRKVGTITAGGRRLTTAVYTSDR